MLTFDPVEFAVAIHRKCALAFKRGSAIVDTRIVYCGDCLDQLKNIPDESVDLVYIDPPFNSNRNYEVFWGETKEKRSFDDRHGSTAAYIDFMRPRCVDLARVLKKTGSFYYHCDWHASHYVKVMLDQIMGENNFVNEIVWKRQTSHNDAKQGSKHYGRVHDTLLFYCGGGGAYTWNQQYTPLAESYVRSHYSQVDEHGRRFQWDNLRAPGGAAPSKGNPHYRVLGTDGFGRSDFRQALRAFFEVDRRYVTVAALKALADEGKVKPGDVKRAIDRYEIDPESPMPTTV